MRPPKNAGSAGVLADGVPPFCLLLLIIAGTSLVCAVMVNRIVADPYMDEIFHVPQAQQFCRGDFVTWNSMITTLPGLYFTSVGFAATILPVTRFFKLAGNIEDLCSLAVLRSVNILLAFICCLLFHQIVKQIEPGVSCLRASAKVLVMALYPLHWFFTFLYYTDVGSTTAVMAMYLACLRKAYWISALFGAVSIMFRQTNIVWTTFATCVGLLDVLQSSSHQKEKGSIVLEPSLDTAHVSGAGFRRRSLMYVMAPATPFCSRAEVETIRETSFRHDCEGILLEAWHLAKLAWLNMHMVLWNFSPLLGVICGFVLFVFYNGGIVVGAKEAHKVSPHFPQLLYFGLTTAAILAPIYLTPAELKRGLIQQNKQNGWPYLGYLLVFGLAVVAVHWFTYAHPYLLADNRHYTFYVWKRIFSAHWSSKYLLIPPYILSWRFILHGLGRTKARLWIMTFLFAVAGVLVPSPVFEFRYYTVPFYIIFLHSRPDRRYGCLQYLFIGAGFAVVNVATLYIFLFRPFEWAHEQGVQRFMW